MPTIKPLVIAVGLSLASICNADEDIAPVEVNKYSNTQWQQYQVDNFSSPYEISLFSPQNGEDSERLWSQTKSIFGYGLGVIGVIALMPEDISNWDKDGEVLSKWGDNVTGGPVWDRDVGWINYIGHPYFGGVYYQSARKSGYRQWDSFIYSVMMSTFYWEYGVEAFAERPAIQDLVVTPVLGWAYGEWAYQKEMDIRSNGGKVGGSEFWGQTALFFLDPVDSLGRGINSLFNRKIVDAGTGFISQKEVPMSNGNTDSVITFNMRFTLADGEPLKPSQVSPSYYNKTNDPIDTSIIGIGFGTGYASVDPVWQLEDGGTLETSLGLYFSRSFSARLSYARGHLKNASNSEFARDDEKFTYENYSINGQYYFNTESDWRPYLTAGIGEEMRDQDRDLKAVSLHAGVGLHYKINNNFAVQTDYRRFITTRYDTQDDLVGVNLIYRFNKGEWY